jgi:multiple antibiotic resistance protein
MRPPCEDVRRERAGQTMSEFLQALVVFFAIIDPIGNLIAFQAVVRGLEARSRVTAALFSTSAAFAILLLFAVTGTAILHYLGISLESFQVSAGLLLGITAVRLVERGEPFHPGAQPERSAAALALVPLATPLLAGPGAIATTVSFSHLLHRGPTIAAAACILALSAALFLAGNWLFEHLAAPVLPVLSRIVGILLTAIAVNLVLGGLKSFFA